MIVNGFEAIQSHIKKFKETLYTSVPAKVVKVNVENSSIKSISAQPFSDILSPTDGVRIQRTIVDNVPVIFPSAGEAILSFPIKEGDTVLLVFCQEDISNFKRNSDGVPDTIRRFSINDAVAIPGLYPTNSNLKPSDTDVELRFRDTKLILRDDGSIDVVTNQTLTISNDTFELISLLSDFLEECSVITTPTIFGATTPINNLTSFQSLKAKIDTMKKG